MELTEGYFRWRSRRGMKELDFILNRFLDACVDDMNVNDRTLFNQLLAEEDMLLWYWLSGKTQPGPEHAHFRALVRTICAVGHHSS